MMKITRKEIVTLEVESNVFDSIMFIINRGSQGTLLDPIDMNKAKKIYDDLRAECTP